MEHISDLSNCRVGIRPDLSAIIRSPGRGPSGPESLTFSTVSLRRPESRRRLLARLLAIRKSHVENLAVGSYPCRAR
jgi:hypothetical protein